MEVLHIADLVVAAICNLAVLLLCYSWLVLSFL